LFKVYAHNEMNHRELFRLTAQLRGDFLMTYDNNEFVRGLAAEFGFDTQTVAMRNTHNAIKSELLVGRKLGWSRARSAKPPRSIVPDIFVAADTSGPYSDDECKKRPATDSQVE
jgi:hypothetical protein